MKTLRNRIFSIVLAAVLLLAMIPGVQATEAWVDPIAADRILFDLRAENFHLPIEEGGDSVVEDPQSPFGKAAHFSYAERAKAGSETSTNSMRFVGQQALKLYVYGGEPKIIRNIGAVTQAQLRANAEAGQYIMYHFEDIDLFPTADNYFLYMFECWGFQIHLNPAQRATIEGQLVDIYLSLKVKGDIAATEGDTAEYFVDRVVIATAEEGTEEHEHDLDAWKAADDFTHEAMCQIPGCGEVVTEDHVWDDGAVTKEATQEEVGIKTYTCQKCQGTRTKKLAYEGDVSANKPAEDGSQEPVSSVNPVIWVAGGMISVALIAIVIAIVLSKKGKKE